MFRSYGDTVAHSRVLQEGAHRITEDAFTGRGVLQVPFALRFYDDRAESAWHGSWQPRRHAPGGGGWHWPRMVRTRWKRPSALRLAIWSGPILCGLAIGHPSGRSQQGRRNFVSVEIIEGAPFKHPLRASVAALTVAFASSYCRILGGSRVRLIDPAAELVGWYARLGLIPVHESGRVIHLEKEL